MNCLLFLQYGLHDDAASNFPYAFLWIHQLPEIHASFVLILLDVPLPQFFIILQGIAGATDVSNFLRAFLMGFFEFRILRVDDIDPAIFERFQDGAFRQTTFVSPSAWRAFPLISRVLAIDDLAWT